MSNVVCRFAVGSPDGRRSSSYRVWTAAKHPDVYIAPRALGAIGKTTLHAARPDLELVEQGHTKLPEARGLAPYEKPHKLVVVSQWEGLEVEPGLVLHMMLGIPEFGLRVFTEARPVAITWIPAPPAGRQVQVSIYTDRSNIQRKVGADHLLGERTLCDGRRVLVVHQVRPEPRRSEFEPFLRAVPVPTDFSPGPGARLVFPGVYQDGIHHGRAGLHIELAADILCSRPARPPNS